MSELKVVAVNILTALAGFLSPIQDFMTAVVLLFIVNFFCGLLAAIVGGEGWKTKKALVFVLHCFVFFGLAAFVFTCGKFMHNESGAVQCVSYICYLAFYIYSVNIVRNLRSCISEHAEMHRLLDVLYYVLTIKFIDRVPYLTDYLKKGKENGAND